MPLPFPSPFSFVFVFVFLFSSLSLLVDCPSANQQTEGQVYSEPVHPPLPTPPALTPLLAPLPAQDQPHPCPLGLPPSIPWLLGSCLSSDPDTPLRASSPLLGLSAESSPACPVGPDPFLLFPSFCGTPWEALCLSNFSAPLRQLNSGNRAGRFSTTTFPAGQEA